MSGPYPPRSDRSRNNSSQVHGGYGRGGRGTAGSAGRVHTQPYSPPDHVVTNLFRVKHAGDPSEPGHQWYQYRLTVTPLRGLIKYQQEQENTWRDLPNANPMKIDRMREGLKENGSTELSRALFRNLSDHVWAEYNIILATGIANNKIPLDENDGDFLIKVDNRGFRIKVECTAVIPMGIFSRLPTNQDQLDTADIAKQCLEIIFKYGLGRTCLSCDTNPQTFFLPEHIQAKLAAEPQSPLHSYWNRPGHNRIAPFEGVTQSARYTNKGEFVVVINNKVDWLYRDSSVNGHDIPVLDKDQCAIAGVKVGSLGRELPSEVLEAVEAAIAKLQLKVVYQKGPAWENERRAFFQSQGKDDAFIDTYIKKHQTFKIIHSKMIGKKEDTGRSKRIKESCHAETFEKDGATMNVEDYYSRYYGIKINFPHLPVVSVGGKGFFPVEFLYQERSRVGGNEKYRQEEVLRYHDLYAAQRRAQRVRMLKEYAYAVSTGFKSLEELLNDFQISTEADPIVSRADILRNPNPQFHGKTATVAQGSGSWNLSNQVFATPADLVMPVILDFTNEDRGLPVEKMIGALFKSMTRHGMGVCAETSEGAPGWKDLIFKYPRGGSMSFDKDKVREARAKFLQSGAPLLSCIVSPSGEVENTWILKMGDKWVRIPPVVLEPCETDAGESHLITNINDPEQTAKARIQFCVGGKWKDPSQTRVDEVIQRWDKFKIWSDDRWITVDENDIGDAMPYTILNDWQIECPSMVLCYISEVDTALYNLLKTVCDISVGLNSQILVKARASAQTSDSRMLQFCSNVALKLNTKLFNRGNRAVAWTIPTKWYDERPTIILGYSVSNGQVRGVASTALVGSVCLFHPMQMGQAVKFYKIVSRRDVVDSHALKNLISDLLLNHFAHTRRTAERVIVYRDGGSRGSMGNIRTEEVPVVQEAFRAVFPEASEPAVTFVVSNQDHNITVVPETWSEDSRSRNVPSGTTLGVVEEFKLSSKDMGEFSFLLTAQGGLKGTSKPMLYTCLVNENQSSGLDKANLKQLTYDLSFQYGSASKAPRKVPVLKNSEKLANRALNYAHYFDMAGVDIGQSSGENREHHFDRSDEMGSTILGGLYPSFGVRDTRCRSASGSDQLRHLRAPFRAHITG